MGLGEIIFRDYWEYIRTVRHYDCTALLSTTFIYDATFKIYDDIVGLARVMIEHH